MVRAGGVRAAAGLTELALATIQRHPATLADRVVTCAVVLCVCGPCVCALPRYTGSKEAKSSTDTHATCCCTPSTVPRRRCKAHVRVPCDHVTACGEQQAAACRTCRLSLGSAVVRHMAGICARSFWQSKCVPHWKQSNRNALGCCERVPAMSACGSDNACRKPVWSDWFGSAAYEPVLCACRQCCCRWLLAARLLSATSRRRTALCLCSTTC